MSGATVTEECLKDFMEFKMPAGNKKKYDYHFIHLTAPKFKLIETKELHEQDSALSNRESWEQMKSKLEDNEAIFIVFNFVFDTNEG